MSSYDFWCPNCGQKMSGDPSYRGKTITCPSCKRTLTVPVRPIETEGPAPSTAGGTPAPAAPLPPGAKPAGSPPARPPSAKKSAAQSGTGKLAVWALVGSVLAVPGIVCGHLALARGRQPSEKEKQLAITGLAIGYCVLAAGLALLVILVTHKLHAPKVEVRDMAGAQLVSPARIVDEVKIADKVSETAHQMKALRSNAGGAEGRFWRATRRANGGSFSYVMKVLPTEPMVLNCTYWGSDTDHREFEIAVNGEAIAKQKLDYNAPGHFFDVEYPIPAGLTRGKTEVTVEFRSARGMTAGGVFGCQMLKK